jgi:hypothetical protein
MSCERRLDRLPVVRMNAIEVSQLSKRHDERAMA